MTECPVMHWHRVQGVSYLVLCVPWGSIQISATLLISDNESEKSYNTILFVIIWLLFKTCSIHENMETKYFITNKALT